MGYDVKSPDEDLLEGCRRENRSAQRLLYERYYSPLMSICMRYTGEREQALDVLHQAFLKVFRHIPGYQPTGSLGGWMARITIHTAMDHLRQQRQYRHNIRLGDTPETGAPATPLADFAADDILRLIRSLPDTQRWVFTLYVIDGYRHREIGEMLGFDEGTSRWHLAQARKQLKANLTPRPVADKQHPDV